MKEGVQMMVIQVILLALLIQLIGCEDVDLINPSVNGEYKLVEGKYRCDSTDIRNGNYLRFDIIGDSIIGKTNLMASSSDQIQSWNSDTAEFYTGEFSGLYGITEQSGFTINGFFEKSRRIKTYDTLDVSQHYMNGFFILDTLSYTEDTLSGFSGNQLGRIFSIHSRFDNTDEKVGGVVNEKDTVFNLNNSTLIWKEIYNLSSNTVLDTFDIQESLHISSIKGDLNSEFRLRIYGEWVFGNVTKNHWLYCNQVE